MALKLVLAANINTVDPQGGGSTALLNVDFRQQPGSGGFFSGEFPASGIAAGSASWPAYVDSIDPLGGGGISVVNVDFRPYAAGDPGSGGFFSAEVATSLLTANAAPAAPTTGSAVSGSLAGATYKIKVTYVAANGTETLASPESSQVVAANSVPTVTSPTTETGEGFYNVYMTTGASGTETLQNSSPIAIGTNYQLPNTGITTNGATPPATAALAVGPCTVTASVATGSLVPGAAIVTVSQ